MITKEIARRCEIEMITVNNPDIKEIQQFEALLRVGSYMFRAIISLIDFAQNLWDNSKASTLIETTPDGSAPANGQYDAQYLRLIQVLFLSFKVWLATPVSVTISGNTITLQQTPRQLIMMTPVVAQPQSIPPETPEEPEEEES